ncbi:MAG: alpha/beta fold hydrolase [Acidimicrobiales bacterium]
MHDHVMRTRRVATNGVELDVVDEGEGPLVVLCHGFPELAYSWRHQIPALTAAGYRVLAPDQRGYGGSSRPEEIGAYDIVHLTDDLLGLLDDTGERKAVFVGHDWGAMVVWAMAQLHPERMHGVVGMSVPFIARGAHPPISTMRHVFGETFFYIVYFQDPGPADEDLDRDPPTTMRRFLAGLSSPDPDAAARMFGPYGMGMVERLPDPKELPAWLNQEELDHYSAVFAATGFTGGLNWYRNMDRNWSLMEPVSTRKVDIPSLFIAGSEDPVVRLTPPSVMDGWVTDLRSSVELPGAGHWVQQERPDEVNAALLDFVGSLGLR